MRQLNIAEQELVAGGLFAGDAGMARIYQINGPNDSAGSDTRSNNNDNECSANSFAKEAFVQMVAGAAIGAFGGPESAGFGAMAGIASGNATQAAKCAWQASAGLRK
jgi:hypothetical protein